MHIKALLPSILLLALSGAAFAAPDNTEEPVRYVLASPMGISRRNPFPLNYQPQFLAMPLSASPLAKRQTTCGTTAKVCYDGCCAIGTVCGIYGGQKGCCPVGKTCSSVSGCQTSDQVFCTTYCCPAGSTCAAGNSCDNGTTGSQCDAGFSPCAQFNGCCPTGTTCVLPKNCDIPCTSSDPICGSGCCQKGYHCTSSGTCAKDTTQSFTSLVGGGPTTVAAATTIVATDVALTNTTYIPSDTLSDSSSTETTDSPLLSTTSVPYPTTTSSTTATRRTIATLTVQKSATGGAAPTMGAMLGGGLGVAAGVLGILAM